MCFTLRGVLNNLLNLKDGKRLQALDLIFFRIKVIAIREMAKYRKLLILKYSDGKRNKNNGEK
jgi:hypothetical protein